MKRKQHSLEQIIRKLRDVDHLVPPSGMAAVSTGATEEATSIVVQF